MVVGFTTTNAYGDYHHLCWELESRLGRRVQHYVIKFVSDLWQVDVFFRAHRFPPPNKADRHDIAEILFKVVINTINPTKVIPSFTMRIMTSRLFCDSLFLELVHMSFIRLKDLSTAVVEHGINMAHIVKSGKHVCENASLLICTPWYLVSWHLGHICPNQSDSHIENHYELLFALFTCCWVSFEAVLSNNGYFFSIMLRIMQHRDIFFYSIGNIRVFRFINCFPFLIASDSTRYQTM